MIETVYDKVMNSVQDCAFMVTSDGLLYARGYNPGSANRNSVRAFVAKVHEYTLQ